MHEQRLGAVGGDIDDACPDRIGGVAEGGWLAVYEELASSRSFRARQHVEQFVLPLALERNNAEDLARPELEGCVLQLLAHGNAAGCESRRSRSCRRGRGLIGAFRQSFDNGAKHQLDDAFLGARRDVQNAHRLALA